MARVQDNLATANGTANPACSFATLPGAGSCIVVAWASWAASGTPAHSSVADNQGGTYTQVGTTVSFNSNTAANVCRISLWKRDNIGSPSGTFTVTGTANQSVDSRFVVIEYGSALTSTLDQNGSDTNASGTAASIALSATTNADDIIVGAASVGSGAAAVTINPDDVELPTIVRENLDDLASQSINVAERLVGATGSYTPAWVTTSAPSGAIAAALKLSQWDGPYFWAAGAAAFTATNGATLTPGLPTGWAADDVHVLLAHRSDNTAMTSLTGWTQISAANNTTAQRVEVWVRRAVAGDTAPTVTFGTSTVVRGARIIGIRGVDTGLDLSTLQLSRSNNAASATITFGTLTPTPANTLLLALYAYEDDPGAASNISSAWQGFITAFSALGNDMALGFAYRQWPSASTATGGLTSTALADGQTFANSPNVGILIALPAASSGPIEAAAGVVAGVSTVAGAITVAAAVVGASAGVSTAGGTLSAAVAAAGATVGASTASGALGATVPVAGVVGGTSTAAGSLGATVPMAAASAATSTAAGTLSATVGLAGAAAGAATTAGVLAATVPVAGASAGLATATAALTVTAGGQEAAAGTTAGVSTVGGTLSAAVGVAGVTAGTSTAGATASATVPLAGTSAGTSTAAATPTGTGQVAAAGASAGASSASGTLSAAVAVSAALAGQSGAVAVLTVAGALAGSVTGTSSTSATGVLVLALVALVESVSSATAALTGGADVLPGTNVTAHDAAHGSVTGSHRLVGMATGSHAGAGSAIGSDREG